MENNQVLFLYSKFVSLIIWIANKVMIYTVFKTLSFIFAGVLTHHLGWVSTVMPGTQAGFNILKKPVVKGKENLYNINY